MLLINLHDEPLLHIFGLLNGKDVCKMELVCRKFKQMSQVYDNVMWKLKCKILWERKVKELVRMSEDLTLPITILDTRNKAEMDALFDRVHVPLQEKVFAFSEVYNMKDSNKLIAKIKKIPKRRRLENGNNNDKYKLDATWKSLYSLDYLTQKFQGKYRKKKGPKLYLSPMLLYSPFTVPKNALPMPKARNPNFQTNRFWGVGNADEIYYVVKDKPAQRARNNSLTTSGENTLKSFFGRGRSNSVSGEPSKTISPSTTLATLPPKTTTTTTTSTHTSVTHSSSSTKLSASTNSMPHATFPKIMNLNNNSTTTVTTTTTTTTTVSSGPSPLAMSVEVLNAPEYKPSFELPMLLPLGHLYFEHRPNGSIDTVGGMWSVMQTRKGRMLVLWRKWKLVCYAEPLMPTKLAYEWLPPAPQIQPTSQLDLHYDIHGPWQSGKVASDKLWKMRPWYEPA